MINENSWVETKWESVSRKNQLLKSSESKNR